MFKEGELDGEKVIGITKIFQDAGFTNFYEYSNPKLRNIRRDLRLFQCGNFCDCGSVITKKVVVDEIVETAESEKLQEIIKKCLEIVDTVYLFSHWYKGESVNEKVNLERASRKVSLQNLHEETFRSMFYNEVLEIAK
jgi:hypothetical protein